VVVGPGRWRAGPGWAESGAARVEEAVQGVWTEDFNLPGANDTVIGVASDGQGNLKVGGRFTSIGGIRANIIAAWDESHWSALGSGLEGSSDSFASSLAVDEDGNPYVAGLLGTAGGVWTWGMAKWDGSYWSR
jgi:hypothetical protein